MHIQTLQDLFITTGSCDKFSKINHLNCDLSHYPPKKIEITGENFGGNVPFPSKSSPHSLKFHDVITTSHRRDWSITTLTISWLLQLHPSPTPLPSAEATGNSIKMRGFSLNKWRENRPNSEQVTGASTRMKEK